MYSAIPGSLPGTAPYQAAYRVQRRTRQPAVLSAVHATGPGGGGLEVFLP